MQYSSGNFSRGSFPSRSGGFSLPQSQGNRGASQIRVMSSSIPNIETKRFMSARDPAFVRIILEKHPNMPEENIQNLYEDVIDFVNLQNNNKKGFAHLEKPLPENTTWADIMITIKSYDKKDAHRCRVEIKTHRRDVKDTNFHEMLLEDTVKGTPSQSGVLLASIALHTKFVWKDMVASEEERKVKERLEKDLKDFFGIDGKPFIIEDNAYVPTFVTHMYQEAQKAFEESEKE